MQRLLLLPITLLLVMLPMLAAAATARNVGNESVCVMPSTHSSVKRNELIDTLIGNKEFVDHWTNKWADLLQVNRKGGVKRRTREQVS